MVQVYFSSVTGVCFVIAFLLYVYLSSAGTTVHLMRYVLQISYLLFHDFCLAALSYFFHLLSQTTNLDLSHDPFFSSVILLYGFLGKIMVLDAGRLLSAVLKSP